MGVDCIGQYSDKRGYENLDSGSKKASGLYGFGGSGIL